MAEKYLGIDIRDEFVALTLVAKTWGGVDLVRSHWFRLFPEQGNEAPESLFVQELNEFLNKGKIKAKAVILSLPRQNCTLQYFDLPAPDAETLDSMIQMELDRHFPFPLNTMNVSYYAVPLETNRVHVIAAAAKRERVEEYLNWMAPSGLKPEVVDLSLFSQMNLLSQNGETGSELQAIVDISSNRMDVALIKGKTLITSRSVPITDEDFKQVFFHTNLSEALMERVAENFSSFLKEVLEATLHGCKSLESEESITQIKLFGGGCALEFLVSPIQNQTGVGTIAVLPEFLKKDPPLNFIPSFHMTSLGLALRPALQDSVAINLHPQAQRSAKRNPSWKSSVVLSVMALTILTGLFLGQIYRNEKTLESLNRQLEEIKPLTQNLEKIDQEYAALSGYTETLNAIERQSPLKLHLLQELSRKLPKDTWVTRIAIKQNRVEIQGYSASASNLIPKLEESEFFKNTQFKGPVTTQTIGKRFTIQSTMEPRG